MITPPNYLKIKKKTLTVSQMESSDVKTEKDSNSKILISIHS
jgi:hypothetical protein